jgi:membrane protein YdbS with pleckstrin-like domain
MINLIVKNSTRQNPVSPRSMAFFLLLCLGCALPSVGYAAVLSMDPSSASFVVGSTFEVPIWVNSEDQPINAISIDIKFPPDKLQLISPSTGRSIITLWTAPPSFNNQTGNISFQGVIPNGITTSRGLITTLSFRVKAPGKAYVQFADTAKVLKHDGLGTDVLNGMNGGVYSLLLPPPAGPLVASPTHADPSITYASNNVILSWVPEDTTVTEYSYVFTNTPLDTPDNISEGSKTSVMYRDISDGRHYFHIKSFRNGVWGGTTHFSLSIDMTPPAEFSPTILPKPPLMRDRESVLQFQTTDAYSGLDYYEVKVVPLQGKTDASVSADQQLFVEATSPYVLAPFSDTGRYDIIVHAFDKTGNMRHSTTQITVASPLVRITSKYIEFTGYFTLSWWIVIVLLLLVIFALAFIAFLVRSRHHRIHTELTSGALPTPVQSAAADLQEKQKQYIRVTQLVILPLLFISGFFATVPAHADTVKLEPPIIGAISHNISNDEIFYVGGMNALPDASIIVYVENSQTGETFTKTATVDRRGEWFYRHDGFLPSGNYVLWAQESVGETMSPPSPQEKLSVHRAALQFGFSRLSYAVLYAMLAMVLLLIVLCLMVYIVFHHREAERKYKRWLNEVREAEESVQRGFAVLKRDIEAELTAVRKMKLTGALRAEEVGREEQLLKDLAWVEASITKEISDIEKER